jgi:hypothetical protein
MNNIDIVKGKAMLYMNVHEVEEGVKEITLTYKEKDMSKELLKDMVDFVLDEYNRLQQDRAFEANVEA